LDSAVESVPVPKGIPLKNVVISFIVLAVVTGGVLSIFASAHPDGLEWALEKTAAADAAGLEREGPVYEAASSAVETTAFMPGYAFAGDGEGGALGTSAAGIIGSGITLIIAGGAGLLIRAGRRRNKAQAA
jgi:cobalt/nickel transport system permease protein